MSARGALFQRLHIKKRQCSKYIILRDLISVIPDDGDFNENLTLARTSMMAGVKPKLVSAGSSGSYFICDTEDHPIAIFKPKDEEPFAELNPKWPKFLQRILCFCCFGRACLIKNNGYLAETGASLVDSFFQLNIVPKTRVVHLTSEVFSYKHRCFQTSSPRAKPGSYQIFLHGYRPACEVLSLFDKDEVGSLLSNSERQRFLMLFQKMCILDYVIRSTDRHLDNWLIRYIPNKVLELAAIDNGLSFPIRHPETTSLLRHFPFGWIKLSWATMDWDESLKSGILSLLTPIFVHTLCQQLRRLFRFDPDTNRFLINSQLKVLRGQIWNLRLALLNDEPPAEMVNRPLLIAKVRRGVQPTEDNWDRYFIVKPAPYKRRSCC